MFDIQYFGNSYKNPLVAIVENFYSEEELQLIWRELEFLNNKNKFLPGHLTNSDVSIEGKIKSNVGLFLDSTYLNRNISDILTLNRKIFDPDLVCPLIELNPIFRHIEKCNIDSTLLSYYENDDSYFQHCDSAPLTALTFFFKEPKSFLGGDLLIPEFNLKIVPKNNMLVIFPGCYMHEVTKVTMEKNSPNGNGRYSMTQFLNYKEHL
jgi:hypothetical protein